MAEFTPMVTDASGKPLKGEYTYLIDDETGEVRVNVTYRIKVEQDEVIDAEFVEDVPMKTYHWRVRRKWLNG